VLDSTEVGRTKGAGESGLAISEVSEKDQVLVLDAL
jgi:hypothetical protein